MVSPMGTHKRKRTFKCLHKCMACHRFINGTHIIIKRYEYGFTNGNPENNENIEMFA